MLSVKERREMKKSSLPNYEHNDMNRTWPWNFHTFQLLVKWIAKSLSDQVICVIHMYI